MQQVLDVLQEHRMDKEADTLEKFYASVQMRADGIDSAEGKQKIVVELYDKFFRNAFPKMTERLGIVYTPVEVVDFIIRSVNDLLQEEFGQTLGSKGVHIIDPFTGTGTFIARLLQSGLIKPEELPHKYKNEIHANEIVLLAYYIAAINIEAVYHAVVGGNYEPFEGICLTDTFQLYEKGDMISNLLVNNSDRRKRQKALDIRVIMGNPPYSAGQESDNDDNQNISYPDLDNRIRETYAIGSSATLQRKLFDSYIRAIRWGSDRLGDGGVMAYVSGSAWIERSFADGMRKCLAEEFTSLYVVHLRGDIRKNMLSKGTAKEGGNIFGSGSMTGIAITFFIKNPGSKKSGEIFFHNIGDDLKSEDKRARLRELGTIRTITDADGWQSVVPDKHYDWIDQRDEGFEQFIKMGDKKEQSSATMFETYSLGVSTNRDTWCYNFSPTALASNMSATIQYYNSEIDRISKSPGTELQSDTTKISWSSTLRPQAEKKRRAEYDGQGLRKVVYRPFTKSWLYFDAMFNDRRGKMPQLFPEATTSNIVIHVSGKGARSGFSALISDCIPDIQHLDNGQCFPLYVFERSGDIQSSDSEDFFTPSSGAVDGYTRRDGISDAGLAHFQAAYPAAGEGSSITKEDLFYYIYGLLHSPEYRIRYADNLSKELPRIPFVKSFADFSAFAQAGRNLAHWHLNYETVDCYSGIALETGKIPIGQLTPSDYRVAKMKFAKAKDPKNGKAIPDKSSVIYNDRITVKGIPLAAYDYLVNGKPALEWVMDRQSVTPDKDSGIVNDANLWATETMGDAKYPLELFLRVITVSLETMKIVNGLPALNLHSSESPEP